MSWATTKHTPNKHYAIDSLTDIWYWQSWRICSLLPTVYLVWSYGSIQWLQQKYNIWLCSIWLGSLILSTSPKILSLKSFVWQSYTTVTKSTLESVAQARNITFAKVFLMPQQTYMTMVYMVSPDTAKRLIRCWYPSVHFTNTNIDADIDIIICVCICFPPLSSCHFACCVIDRDTLIEQSVTLVYYLNHYIYLLLWIQILEVIQNGHLAEQIL